MTRRALPLALLLAVAARPSAPAAAGDAPASSLAPVDQRTLKTWWHATNTLWMADTAYEVKGTHFEDGVCSYDFEEGLFIPIYNGRAPVAERQVGVVFVGKGSLTLSFPEPGDAAAFANHMVRQAGADPDTLRAIAAGQAPFRTSISQGMIVSADPAVQRLLYDLEPVGGGVVYREGGTEGVDAEYVITDDRVRLKARAVATNLLPARRNALTEEGLDPVAMLRQDRLLHAELGYPGDQLRLVADFRTDTSFRVAAESGATATGDPYDRWVTCFRDGLGQTDLGFRSTAFTFGKDNDGDTHFQRLAGRAWSGGDGAAPAELPVRPEPVSAAVEIAARPANFFSNQQHAAVDSTFTLRAVGGPLRHAILRLPAAHTTAGSFRVTELALADGRPLPWVSLTYDLAHRDARVAEVTAGGEGEEGEESAAPTTEGAEGGATDVAGTVAEAAESAQQDQGTVDEGERGESRDLFHQSERRLEVIALLPEPVPEGQDVRIRLRWEADWQYANWSFEGRPLGATTGFQPVLPEILPSLAGNAWDFTLKMSVPGISLRTFAVAASGDTTKKWDDLDGSGRRFVETEGKGAREVGVAIGQWKERDEPPASEMPGVSTHLFFQHASALPGFAPEARRIVSFLERFLPDFPQREVEIWQGAGSFANEAQREGFYDTAHGLVGITTVKQYTTAGDDLDVGEASAVRKENPWLAQTMLARQIAHQYFGQAMAPATPRDRWLDLALSDAYALFYIRAALGKDPFDERLATVREGLEDPTEREATAGRTNRYQRPYSLTGATTASDISAKLRAEYGMYVVAQMLRHKVGDQPFFLAIDRMVGARQGQTLTTERFQQLMEAASGQDLDDFFGFWVHGGAIPEVTLQVRADPVEGGFRMHGCLVSDVPFGTFEVPVQLFDPATGKIAGGPVKVVDGHGRFDVGGWKSEPEVELDPEALILAYGRKVKRLDGPSACEEVGR